MGEREGEGCRTGDPLSADTKALLEYGAFHLEAKETCKSEKKFSLNGEVTIYMTQFNRITMAVFGGGQVLRVKGICNQRQKGFLKSDFPPMESFDP